jgi:hypothetical protein
MRSRSVSPIGQALAAAALAAAASLALVAAPGDARADAPRFRLPWGAGASQYLTQDANDACCSDHVGANKYAFDFALPEGGAFDVVAPADGTLVHVKMSSTKGCGDASCVSDANYVVIDHGDGTQTTMLHLAQGSLDPSLACGGFVRRGQRVATTGSTGWSTGVHLHVERDQVKRDLKKVCECGADGRACAPGYVEWGLFWPSTSQPNVALAFEEWASAAAPDNRRGLIGPSKNADDRSEIVYVDAARSSALGSAAGTWRDADDGGRRGGYKWARASDKPSAVVALASAEKKPLAIRGGTYALWAYVPVGLTGGEASYELRGAADGVVKGSLSLAGSGGAFRPIRGLERVRLAATGKETLAIVGSGEASQTIALDAIALQRVGELDDKPKVAALAADPAITTYVADERGGLVGFELEGNASHAIGGGVSLPSLAESRVSGLPEAALRELGLGRLGLGLGLGTFGIAAGAVALARRRRRIG